MDLAETLKLIEGHLRRLEFFAQRTSELRIGFRVQPVGLGTDGADGVVTDAEGRNELIDANEGIRRWGRGHTRACFQKDSRIRCERAPTEGYLYG